MIVYCAVQVKLELIFTQWLPVSNSALTRICPLLKLILNIHPNPIHIFFAEVD